MVRPSSAISFTAFFFALGVISCISYGEEMDCHNSFNTLACFKPYKTNLQDFHKDRLEKIADEIGRLRQSKSPIDHVTLIGHSAYWRPDDPAYENGLERAQNTAAFLRAALSRRQISGIHITTGSVGAQEPRTSNDTRQGRNLNRRVELFLRTKRVALGIGQAQQFCQIKNRQVRVVHMRDRTCHSNRQAESLCRNTVTLGSSELLGGAACLPLDIRCVICLSPSQ